MEFRFEETMKTIKALQDKFNSIKYDHPQACTLKLAYVTALEAEFAACHKVCTETKEEFSKRTAQEVLSGLKKR